ncbi:PREDICTED: defensin-like protein 50 [Camelina sativa]|uniref:Defensin-like protein 50 n=1 Tax=Camelina sativa TaxID=90675 RepID=A0ABM0Y7N7_CAMSA|nr:PREDICTED: defensin-like protein 50 [Camelina sativa]
MGYTKILLTLFLVVILAISSSPQKAMASEIKAKINGLKCFDTCTPSYDDYKCHVDCMTSGYAAGGCTTLSPSQPQKCCCY